MNGKLYLVGTPIGNLGDISPRCANTLAQVDFIAAEDTRNTQKLLNHLDIKKETVSYYEHNKAQKGAQIVERMLAGQSCALVTDAGMPAISDPGEDLVRLCHEAGVEVVVIPGPCAAVSALALSGLPTGRFSFEGFLPSNANQRKAALEKLKREERTMIFYEAPHRLYKTVKDMYEALGEREAAFCKEITKLHEKVIKLPLSEACEHFTENEKGEFVIIIDGYKEAESEIGPEDIKKLLLEQIEKGMSVSSAVKAVALQTGVSKNTVYKLANSLNF